MEVCNDGNPTFIRGESTSHIDVTCVSSNLANKVTKWHMLDVEMQTNHRAIYFELKYPNKSMPKYDTYMFDKVKLKETLKKEEHQSSEQCDPENSN